MHSPAGSLVSSGLHLVCGHHVGLDMRILAVDGRGVPIQESALTADAGPHQLHLAHQAGRQYAAPMYKPLQAAWTC